MIEEIAKELEALAAQARANNERPEDRAFNRGFETAIELAVEKLRRVAR